MQGAAGVGGWVSDESIRSALYQSGTVTGAGSFVLGPTLKAFDLIGRWRIMLMPS